MTTRKQQNAIKEAQLVGQLIGGFASTQPQAYTLTDGSGLTKHRSAVNDKEYCKYIYDNLQVKSRAAFRRIFNDARTKFPMVTGYSLVGFDSGLEEGRYAQYDVEPTTFTFEPMNDEQSELKVKKTFGFIAHAPASFMNTVTTLNLTVIQSANETFQKELV